MYEDKIFPIASSMRIILGGGWGNMIAIVILLSFLKRLSLWRKQVINVKSVITLQLGEGLTWFNKNNRANFSDEEKYDGTFRDVCFV